MPTAPSPAVPAAVPAVALAELPAPLAVAGILAAWADAEDADGHAGSARHARRIAALYRAAAAPSGRVVSGVRHPEA